MTRFTLIAGIVLGTSGVASAQPPGQLFPYPTTPYYTPPTVMPNIYNPQLQPLSPYLNLLRSGNAGVNYYYGVRPGTMGGMGQPIGAPFSAGGNRPLFFPQLASAPDPLQPREAAEDRVLPPAGHPVFFNNTMGYFPSPFGARGGAARPGLAGVGGSRR